MMLKGRQGNLMRKMDVSDDEVMESESTSPKF